MPERCAPLGREANASKSRLQRRPRELWSYYRITRIYKMISHSNSRRYNGRRYRYNHCGGNINFLFHYRHIVIGESCFFCWLVVTFVGGGDGQRATGDYDVYLFCPLTIWAATTATAAADTAAAEPALRENWGTSRQSLPWRVPFRKP